MLICDTCKKTGEPESMMRCPKCEKIFHKNVNCVNVREIKLETEKACPLCGQKTKKLNERTCPSCGEHLWSLHIDCGGIFKGK